MNMVNLDRDKFGRFKKGHIPWHRGKKAFNRQNWTNYFQEKIKNG